MALTLRRLAFVAAAGLLLAGCSSLDSFNPFSEKDVHLEGERHPVFPPGDPRSGPRRLPPPQSDSMDATIRAEPQPATAE